MVNWLAYEALVVIPATTSAFVMSFAPIFVVVLGTTGLREVPKLSQAAGFAVVLLGS